MTLTKEADLQALRRDSVTLAEAARQDLTVPIPSCPGWSMADLVVHTGGVHRAQARIVTTRAQEPMGIAREMFDGVRGLLGWLESSTLMGGESDLSAIPAGLVDWFEEGAAILVAALAEADPEEAVWSWSDDHRVQHYLRMMPIETAIHRWDAQNAVGQVEPVERPLAAEGISHTFEVMMPSRRAHRQAPPGEGESFRFVMNDGPEVWTVRFPGEPVVRADGEGKVDLTLSGSASDLMLFLWGRLPVDRLEAAGDVGLVQRYFELVPPV
ncbi:MAG TPA: maleylpyruvate isomerase family mycothiol-dependent enzyme [Chloroflexota bacterium]|nr:maleylpyruvate isomerase family mycothiol-dependent enzyme [Chloroflexota bacterium]